MVYSKSIVVKCAFCWHPATCEVFGNKNQSYGKFCAACGERRVLELLRQEAKELRRT